MNKAIKFLMTLVLMAAFTNSANAQTSWGDWTTTDCFKGVDFRVKRSKTASGGEYQWDVQFRNRYDAKVDFHYAIVPSSERAKIKSSGNTTTNKQLKPNTTESALNCGYRFLTESSNVYVYVNKMVFGRNTLNSEYANCDQTR